MIGCSYEWKRSEWNITQQECGGRLLARTHFAGSYGDHVCAVTVSRNNTTHKNIVQNKNIFRFTMRGPRTRAGGSAGWRGTC